MEVVRLSALRTGPLYSKEIFLVLISVGGRVDPRAKMRPERISKLKVGTTTSGIEITAIRLAVKSLNKMRHRVLRNKSVKCKVIIYFVKT